MPFVKRNHELDDSRIERVRGRLAVLSMLTIRVVDLEYS